MNLITSEGLAMIDTDNVVQFQSRSDLHRYFAPGVIEGHRAPMTTVEKVMLVLIYAASVFIVFALIGWGFEELKRIDLAQVAQLLGVRR